MKGEGGGPRVPLVAPVRRGDVGENMVVDFISELSGQTK